MKKLFFVVIFTLAFCAWGIQSTANVHADGFGITPPYVKNDSLTQSSHYEQTIILVRGNPDQDLKAKVTVNIPGANNWIAIDKGTEFTLPAGTQQMPMVVTVNVPGDAKLGRYMGNIQVVVSPLAPPTAGTVGVTIGAQIDVDLQIIDQKMVDFTVHRVSMTNAEEGSTWLWMHFPGKVLFTMDLQNTGNIEGSPKKVVFNYGEYLTNKVIETETNSNGLASVKPFESKQVVAEIPTYLPQGSYRIFYQIYGRDDENIIGQGNLDLSVLPHGTLAAYVGYGFWGLRWQEKLMTFGIVAGIFLALWGLFTIGKRFFRRPWRKRYDRVLSPPPPPPPPPPRY